MLYLKLPTTSFLSFQDYVNSTTHPSLPYVATTYRSVVRHALKAHKRLPQASQPAHLATVLAALHDYIPYLFALDAGLSSRPLIAGEELDLVLEREVEVEWRPTLAASGASSVGGRFEPPRAKLQGLDFEISFTLYTLAACYVLQARAQSRVLFDVSLAEAPSAEQRATAVATAMKYLLDAHGIYIYLLERARNTPLSNTSPPVDITSAVLSALASLTLSSATLAAVLKDDPYAAAQAQSRNKTDKEWMYKAPTIPKVRARLFAHLCLASAEHATKGASILATSRSSSDTLKLSDELPRYLEDLRRTARAKACRFLGIDAELAGETGKAIGYLLAARSEIEGGASSSSSPLKHKDISTNSTSTTHSKDNPLSRFKKEFLTRREDRRVATNTATWGSDAGLMDESRVVEALATKWSKMNDTVGMQHIPEIQGLIASLPSGREYHVVKTWQPIELDEHVVVGLRASVDRSKERNSRGGNGEGDGGDSSEDEESLAGKEPVGAFPGTAREYIGSEPGSGAPSAVGGGGDGGGGAGRSRQYF